MSTASGSTFSTVSRASAHSRSFDSSSSRTSPFSDQSNTDRQGYLQGQLRAGGPYLCSHPATTVPFGPAYYRRNPEHSQVEPIAQRILAEEGIPYDDVEFCGRRSKVDPEPQPVSTVLIVTKRCVRPVAKKIQQALASLVSGICVEMTDDILLRRIRCFPVLQTDSIIPNWDYICQAIMSQCIISEWTAIECWRIGTGDSASANPVTLVVSVRKGANGPFHTSKQRIRGILARYGETDVDILFQESEIHRCVSDPVLPQEALTPPASPGVSIGIHDSDAGSSTLVGMVRLKFAKQGLMTFGLTCFHCVWAPEDKRQILSLVPNANEAFQRWMFSPVTLGKKDQDVAKKILRVDHPSVGDLRRTIEDLTGQIEEILTPAYEEVRKRAKEDIRFLARLEQNQYNTNEHMIASWEEERAAFQKFLDDKSYPLGHVFVGSGMNRRKAQESRPGLRRPGPRFRQPGQQFILDWALIQFRNERRGEHKPCLYGSSYFRNRKPNFGQASFEETISQDAQLFKSGRSTYVTRGRAGPLKSVQISHRPIRGTNETTLITTWEYTVTNPDGVFVEPGDSGAFVFSAAGGVVGLFWGALERNYGTGYVTPIDDILNDIKLLTNAQEVEIVP